jgi:hypothetical protein
VVQGNGTAAPVRASRLARAPDRIHATRQIASSAAKLVSAKWLACDQPGTCVPVADPRPDRPRAGRRPLRAAP